MAKQTGLAKRGQNLPIFDVNKNRFRKNPEKEFGQMSDHLLISKHEFKTQIFKLKFSNYIGAIGYLYNNFIRL